MSWQAGKGQKQAGDLFWLIPPGLITCFLQTKQYFSFIKKIKNKKIKRWQAETAYFPFSVRRHK